MAKFTQSNPFNLPTDQLEDIFYDMADTWELVRDQNILISGGTGFIGKWLLAAILDANSRLNLNIKIYLVTRSIKLLLKKFPSLEMYACICLIECDIKDLSQIDIPFCAYGVHGALDVDKSMSGNQILDNAYVGTKAFINKFSKKNENQFQSMILLSSGAVYGPQFSDSGLIKEDLAFAPSCTETRSAYGEGKRVSELICALAQEENEYLNCAIARCFACVGPWLPMRKQFAIGNFISDVHDRNTIKILGDGTPLRSYIYSSDLTYVLWQLLFKNQGLHAYNVGSDNAISIEDLAILVLEALSADNKIEVLGVKNNEKPAQLYVPSISKLKTTINWEPKVNLPEAIQRTANWSLDQGIIYGR